MLALWILGITGLCPISPSLPSPNHAPRIRTNWTSSKLYPHSSQPVDNTCPVWANSLADWLVAGRKIAPLLVRRSLPWFMPPTVHSRRAGL